MFSVADGECAFVAEVKNANTIVPRTLMKTGTVTSNFCMIAAVEL